MKNILHEKIDYDCIYGRNSQGYETVHLRLKDHTVLRRVHSPNKSEEVLLEEENSLQLVRIRNGKLESGGRISNLWEWVEINSDGTNGEVKSGYGYFYQCPGK